MSKFPNHGLLARTASASSRSASLLAHTGRSAHCQRPLSAITSAQNAQPSSLASSSSSSSTAIPSSYIPSSSPFLNPSPFSDRRVSAARTSLTAASSSRSTEYIPLWRASNNLAASSSSLLPSQPSSSSPTNGVDVSGDIDQVQAQLDGLALDSRLLPNFNSDFERNRSTLECTNSAVADLTYLDSPYTSQQSRPSSPPHSSSNGSFGDNGSSSSSSNSSSSSSSSSQTATSTVSARPKLATSTATQDMSGNPGSGSSTPTTNRDSDNVLDNALSSVAATGAFASLAFDKLRASAAAINSDVADQPGLPPLWAQSFSAPRHRKLNYTFEHGAYGIPKRHPWAAVRGNGKRAHPPAKPVARTGAVGMLAAAADFLTGGTSPTGPVHAKEKLGGEVLTDKDGRRLGLNSPIREHGRIVQDRLESVQVGEDAYFLRPDALGVADGVGGWASRAGADPALFSRLLMHFCASELAKYDHLSAEQLAAEGGKLLKEWESIDPVEVMHTAWERCVRASRREGILGSSTALIALLRGDELRIANLGDCVLLIIRAGELLFRSTEQQHSFNFPVQLGMMGHDAESVTLAANSTLSKDGFLESGASDDLDDLAPNPLGTSKGSNNARSPTSNGASSSVLNESNSDSTATISPLPDADEDEVEWDEPRRDAGRWSIKVQKGDIIIIGSDGLVDNLFDEDIVEEVLKFVPPPPTPVGTDESGQGYEFDDNHSQHSTGEQRVSQGRDEYKLPEDFDPQLVSEALCSRAKAVSEDSRAVTSPFQQRAMEEGLHYVGGKHDDISVVVAVVGEPVLDVEQQQHYQAQKQADGRDSTPANISS